MKSHLRILPFAALLAALLSIAGCASSGDDGYLLKSLDNPSKARALTAAGIEAYELRLVRRGEFDRIAEVREYFVVALRYDPSNALARKYLTLVTTYRDSRLKASLKEASRLAQKPKRTDEETYQMCVAAQRAARIDPSNAEVQKILADTTQARSAYVQDSLARARAATEKVDEKTPDPVREKLTIEAFQQVSRALAVDPKNGAVESQKSSLRASMSAIAEKRLAAVNRLTAAGSFPEAKAQLAQLADLSRKMGGGFDGEVRAASYALNYKWARSLADQREYEQAEVRVDAALAVKRTEEATALKRRITELRSRADTAASFEAALQDIDRLISRGELLAAQRRIEAVTQNTTGSARLGSLEERGDRIRANLKTLYDKAVEAYREEDFKSAIELLETVVAIDEGYEQAADYLDKAQSKQKLLEQF